MKNRKAPVMLFGLVVVAIGGMTIVNALQRPQTPEAQQEQKEEAVADRQITDKDKAAVGQSLLKHLGPSKTEKSAKHGPADPSADVSGPATEPTIYLRSTSNFPPQPNDASTATHWYDPESRSAGIAAENAKGKG